MMEKEMELHLITFPERREALLQFQKKTNENFEEVKKQIEIARTHTAPSPVTLSKIEGIDHKVEEVKNNNEKWTISNDRRMERIERVLFGDPFDDRDPGLNQMVKDIHNKAIGKDGFWNQVFFIGKVAGTWTAIVVAFAFLYNFMKK